MTSQTDLQLTWHNVTDWGVEGRAWEEHERLRYFDRLPAAAEQRAHLIKDAFGGASAWEMSRCSAGMAARFNTDATAIHVRYELLNEELALPHMPATGVSGVDLYARNEKGEWRYVQGIKPVARSVKGEIISGLEPTMREYALYLPLYNGVDSLEIGVPSEAVFSGVSPRANPVVFYGTSITQGGVASRPGAAYVSILGRRLGVPVLNLGFSGTGKMNSVIGEYMVQVAASAYVIDCSGNMQPEQIRERCIPLVKQLREARPDTPIVLVEDRQFPNAWIDRSKRDYTQGNHRTLRECFETLQSEGMESLYYIEGDALYGTDSEGSTDNAHANDLGFKRMADVMEPALREALHLKA